MLVRRLACLHHLVERVRGPRLVLESLLEQGGLRAHLLDSGGAFDGRSATWPCVALRAVLARPALALAAAIVGAGLVGDRKAAAARARARWLEHLVGLGLGLGSPLGQLQAALISRLRLDTQLACRLEPFSPLRSVLHQGLEVRRLGTQVLKQGRALPGHVGALNPRAPIIVLVRAVDAIVELRALGTAMCRAAAGARVEPSREARLLKSERGGAPTRLGMGERADGTVADHQWDG